MISIQGLTHNRFEIIIQRKEISDKTSLVVAA